MNTLIAAENLLAGSNEPKTGTTPHGPNGQTEVHRRRLRETRTAITHRFDIAGHDGYITVGLFDDGQPLARSSL